MTGVDVSERMLELARAEERRAPLGIRYERTSYADLGAFPDGSFDAVVSFMALMDGARFDAAMRECFRVLRPGGMLAFSITHPCFLTKGLRWLRDPDGTTVGLVVARYFDPAGRVERWRFADASPETTPFAVPCFDRTLSEYVNGVAGAGFVLTGMNEPRPSEEECRAHPFQRAWRDHAALFLHVRAEKPR
jgi:SAM-dependent methyltransferase